MKNWFIRNQNKLAVLLFGSFAFWAIVNYSNRNVGSRRVESAQPAATVSAPSPTASKPELRLVDTTSFPGRFGASLDNNGVRQFTFDFFSLGDQLNFVQSGLALKSGGHASCRDAGYNPWHVPLVKCSTEVDSYTGEHEELTFFYRALVSLDWYAPIGNYASVRDALVKAYGAPKQRCDSGDSDEGDYWCSTQRMPNGWPFRYARLTKDADTIHVELQDNALSERAISQAIHKDDEIATDQ